MAEKEFWVPQQGARQRFCWNGLEPARDNDLGVGEKLEYLPAVSLEVTKKRVPSTSKGEKGHGRGNADIYAEHTRFHVVLELAGGFAAACI